MVSKIEKVKTLVMQRGGWRSVFCQYPALLTAFDKQGREHPCPKSGSGKTKFSFFKDADSRGAAFHRDCGGLADGIDVIAWFEGVSKTQAMDIIINICGGDLSSITPAAMQEMKKAQSTNQVLSEEEIKLRKTKIHRAWKGCTYPMNTTVEHYLRSRGIQGDPRSWNNLYCHSNLAYMKDPEKGWQHFPAMLAIVRDVEGKSCTLHRTFLSPDGQGKAPVDKPKLVFSPPRSYQGGCIKIDHPVNTPLGKMIGISEGIETALSVREATGCPMWVGISDYQMANVVFPDDVKIIIVWADIEPSGAGLRAAETLRRIWSPKGVQVIIEAPHFMGRDDVDWNDVYRERGQLAFQLKLEPEYRVYTGVEVL